MQDRTAHTQATVTLGQCHACSSGVVDHQCGSNVDYATTMRCDPGSLTGNTGNTATTPQISTRSVLESKVAQHMVQISVTVTDAASREHTHSQCQHAVSAGRQICQQCVNAKSTVLAPLASQYTGISCSSQNTGIDAGPRHFRNGTTMHHSQADKSVPSNRTKHRSHGSNGIDIDHGTHSAAGTEYAIFCGVELQILTLCFR